jgi:tetratricopeptide (TPR) repeat protein
VYRMAVAVELVGRAERDSGDAARALETWTSVRDQIRGLVGDDRSVATRGSRAMIARLDFQIGTIYQGYGKTPAAIDQYELAKRQFAALLAEDPGGADVLLHAAENHDRLGDLLRNEGKLEEALDEYTQAQTARKRASSPDRKADDALALSASHLKLGSIHQSRADTATAFTEYRSALRLLEALLAAEPDNIEALERAVSVQDTIAELQRQSGESANAVKTYEAAVPIVESMMARDPTNTTWQRQYGNLLADLGFALLDTGAFARGLEILERAIGHQHSLVARDPQNTSWRVDLSRSFTRAGDAHLHLGDVAAAIDKFERGLALRNELAKLNPKSAPYRRLVAWSHAKLGNAYGQRADFARAITAHERALELRDRLVKDSPGQSAFRNELASTELVLGKLLAARDPKRSTELIDRALQRARSLVAGDPINNEWKETLTQALLARADAAKVGGDRAGREAVLVEAQALARATADASPHNSHWPAFLAEIHGGLAEVASDPKTAAAEWQRVRELLEPLAAAGRLSATRKELLQRARSR